MPNKTYTDIVQKYVEVSLSFLFLQIFWHQIYQRTEHLYPIGFFGLFDPIHSFVTVI
jgi:hypothetical protein